MAKKESLLDLCTRATNQANNVSVRMLECLSTVKSQPHGFRELATDFLDICRILYSTEAGLQEAARKRKRLPEDMVTELDKKLRQANDNILVLNQMLMRFLEYEGKGKFGKLQKGFRMMFADGDVAKFRAELTRTRDALRMSAVVFSWSLGDRDSAQLDPSNSIAFTGLAAALDRMNMGKRTISLTQAEIQEPNVSSVHHNREEMALPPLPVTQIRERPTTPPAAIQPDHRLSTSLDRLEQLQMAHSPSGTSSHPGSRSHRTESTSLLYDNIHLLPEDEYSDGTVTSRTLVDAYGTDGNIKEDAIQEIIHLKVDPTAVPRRTARRANTAANNNARVALMDAVRDRKYRALEQLLDSGVRSDGTYEANVMRQAILNRDTDSIRLLLVYGFDANWMDDYGETSHLHSATKTGFLEGAALFIKYGADINISRGANAISPLALAVAENKPALVHLLLSYGANPDLIMTNGDTPLITSISKATPLELVELMLKYEADPNAKNGEGKTALFEAVQVDRIDLIALLLDHGADPNLPGPKHLLWPSVYKPKALRLLLQRGANAAKAPGIVELATSIKNREAVTTLLEAGVSPNIKKDGIYTPLCSAIRDNSGDLVTLLLANGADPNLAASEYPAFKCVTHQRTHLLPALVTAGADLHNPKGIIEKAIAHSNFDAMIFLLDQGAGLDDRGSDGHTALTTAIREDRLDIVELLLAKGADPAVRGQDWPISMAVKRPPILKVILPYMSNPRAVRGVIEAAVEANELESVKLLLAAGLSVEDKTGGVFSPLTSAIRDQRVEMTRYLLDEAGADPNAPGEHLPIVKALRRMKDGDTTILEMLLDRGADINKMYRGWNAVLQAVENGDARVLQVLLDGGAPVDLYAQDESGKPVIEIVKERGWDEAVTMLQRSVEVAQ